MLIEIITRRLITAASLAALSACTAAPTLIGDPNRPIMVPGEGLIAASVAFTTSMPDFMRYPALLCMFDFEATDGGKREISFGLTDETPRHVATLPHGPNDTPPILLTKSVKPGKYRFTEARVSEGEKFSFRPVMTREITVVAGQVTYVGNLVFSYSTKWQGAGALVLRDVQFKGPHNEFDRDIAALRSAERRFDTVTITNALSR